MKKDLLAIGFIILIIAVLINGTEFQTVDEYYLTHIDDIKEDSETVFISIECSEVFDNWNDLKENLKNGDYIPSDGVILAQTEYVLREGDTVFDILSRVTRYNKIQMEYQGADMNMYNSVYIQGINYLYECDCGELSGWIYSINGESPKYGCSNYVLKDGDVIKWTYTCELGGNSGSNFID